MKARRIGIMAELLIAAALLIQGIELGGVWGFLIVFSGLAWATNHPIVGPEEKDPPPPNPRQEAG